MTDITTPVVPVGQGLSIGEIDIRNTVLLAAALGDVFTVPWSLVIASGVGSGSASTVGIRRTNLPGVVVKLGALNGAIGDIVTLRIQGSCKANVRSSSSTALAVEDRLGLGTPAVNKCFERDTAAADSGAGGTNCGCYSAISADSGAMTTTGVMKNVILFGLNGLGLDGGVA